MAKVLERIDNLDPQASTDMVGLTLFSLQEWQYHFMFGFVDQWFYLVLTCYTDTPSI